MEQLVLVAKKLRLEHDYRGYIHLKTIPEADAALIAEAGRWADRLSVNIELPTEQALETLAPEKRVHTIKLAMGRIRTGREEAEDPAPPFAPAGQSTQLIVGADDSDDRRILALSESLYGAYKLKRVYYSAYSPIPKPSATLPSAPPPLQREHRLYQADWLMRYYGFTAGEILPAEGDGALPLNIDPKLAWALAHRERFPLDVNVAPREELLRVPGLGVRNVDRILATRRSRRLRYADLSRLRCDLGKARALLQAAIPPEDVEWQVPGESSLFDTEPLPEVKATARIPRELVSLLEASACHADPDRWALMYRLLWRVARGSHRALLADAADADVAKLATMARAVDREVHQMHAFVRFKEGEGGLYEAWFEPEHDILRRAAPFFRDRFASMRWIIATPRGAAHWDGEEIAFVDAPMARPAASEDAKEALWRTYYASIFNPTRLNPKAMRQHMPQRYWKNLSAQDIARLSQPRDVLQAPVAAPRWAGHVHVDVPNPTGLQSCRRCPLWENATQAVPGDGPAAARVMLVGEQPGDEEDLKGRPFVGPAGKVLERALLEAGIARGSIYVTNAVKHFKWEPRGKRRLHKTPAQREIEACHLWLERELADVKPEVIVAMGATAAFALAGEKLSIAKLRTMQMRHASGALLIVTYHPSAILRGEERAQALFDALRDDLRRAAGSAAG